MKVLAFFIGMLADAIAAIHLLSATKTEIGPWVGTYAALVLMIIILCGGVTGLVVYNGFVERIKRKEHDRLEKHLGRR